MSDHKNDHHSHGHDHHHHEGENGDETHEHHHSHDYGHDHGHDHGHEHSDQGHPGHDVLRAKPSLMQGFRKAARYIKSHKGETGALLGALLLSTTALSTPLLTTAIGAGALIVGSIYMLKKTTDMTLDGSLAIGKKLKLSPLTLGLAIGALNTVPEIMVSIGAMMRGATEIGIGNIVGSNIAHTLLILGATAAVAGIKSSGAGLSWKFNTAVMAGATALFGSQLLMGSLSPVLGVAMLGAGGYYLTRRLFSSDNKTEDGELKEPDTCVFHGHGHHGHGDHHDHDHDHDHDHGHEGGLSDTPAWFKLGWGLAGFGGLMAAADLLVSGGTAAAIEFGVSEAIIGTLAVAIGTSIPELLINIKAARNNHSELAVGNILGCNIFNTLIAGGVLSLTGHAVPESLSLSSDLGILNTVTFFGSAGLLTAALLMGKGTVQRWQGLAAGGLYVAYTAAAMALNGGHVQELHKHDDALLIQDTAQVLELVEMPENSAENLNVIFYDTAAGIDRIREQNDFENYAAKGAETGAVFVQQKLLPRKI